MNILHEVSKVYDTRVNPVHIEGEVRRGGAGGWRCLRSARHTQRSAAGGGGCACCWAAGEGGDGDGLESTATPDPEPPAAP